MRDFRFLCILFYIVIINDFETLTGLLGFRISKGHKTEPA